MVNHFCQGIGHLMSIIYAKNEGVTTQIVPVVMDRVILRNLVFMRPENASFFELLKPLTLFGNQDLIFLVPNGSLKPKN